MDCRQYRQEEAANGPSGMVLPLHGPVVLVPVDAVFVSGQLRPSPLHVASWSQTASLDTYTAVSCDIAELTRHLPNSILDRQCEQIPLTKISTEMTMCDTLFTFLGISRVKNGDIATRYHNSPERQRQELLFVWQEENGMYATYRALIKCFCEAKRKDLVTITCRILQEHYSEAATSTLVASPSSTTHVAIPGDTTLATSPDDTTVTTCTTPGDTTLVASPGSTNLATSPGDTTLVASPDRREEKNSMERTALVRPQRSPSQEPSPAIPFHRQQSRLQSPGTEPASDQIPSTGTPSILTTMPSCSSSSEDQSDLSIFPQPDPEVPQPPMQALASTEHLLPEVQRSHSNSSLEDSFHTARTHMYGSTQSIDDLSDGDGPGDSTTADDFREDFNRVFSKWHDVLLRKDKKGRDLKAWLKEKAKEAQDLAVRLKEKEKEVRDLELRLKQKEEEVGDFHLRVKEKDKKILDFELQLREKEERVLELELRLKEKEEEVAEAKKEWKELKDRLAEKEQELASRSPPSVPESSECDQLRKELQISNECLLGVESERKELAAAYVEACSELDTYRNENSALSKENMELKRKLVHSQQETYDCRTTITQLTQNMKSLKDNFEAFFPS